MASHYDIASLVKCVILIVPANDAHFYKNITGKYKVLEVINSGSCFEIPKATLLKIKEKMK